MSKTTRTTARPAAKTAPKAPKVAARPKARHEKDLAEMTDDELEAMALEAAEVAADEAARPAAKVAPKAATLNLKERNAQRKADLEAKKATAPKAAPAAKAPKAPKAPAVVGKGHLKITALIKENPCRPGFCFDQVEAALTSATVAEAQKKLADKGHHRRLEIYWMVGKGYISVAE